MNVVLGLATNVRAIGLFLFSHLVYDAVFGVWFGSGVPD